MPSQIACPYKLTVVGAQSVAALQAQMAKAPYDNSIPLMVGLRLISDTIGDSGQDITRTLTFTMVPSVPAVGTVSFVPGDGTGSPLNGVNLSVQGVGYAAPPIVTLDGGDAPLRKALLTASMGLSNINLIKSGSGYTTNTKVTLVGGQLAPGGVQGTAHANITAGVLQNFVIDSVGGPYNVPPDVVISDTGGGSGGVGSSGLGVTGVNIVYIGIGYNPRSSYVLTFTPVFLQQFPSGNEGAAVRNFMRGVFEEFVDTPVYGLEPVVS